jgi:hypothetical protein
LFLLHEENAKAKRIIKIDKCFIEAFGLLTTDFCQALL